MDDHHHQPPTPPEGPAPAGLVDPAAQSLADALRVSFRLLSFIMAVLFVGFLGSGITCINPQEVGVKKTFGRVTGVAEQGLTYTWPFPVGEIEKVPISEKKVEIDDFWMHETPEDKTKDLSERTPPKAGLRPGWDGAVLTGDRYLLHVKLTCNYNIVDALAFAQVVGGSRDAEQEIIRSAVCSAVVRISADRTAESIKKDQLSFTRAVREEAQRQLDDWLGVRAATARCLEGGIIDPAQAADLRGLLDRLGVKPAGAGIRINDISMRPPSWPLLARPAYEEAQRATSERQQKVDEAIAEARRILNAAAGANYVRLVGEPWQSAQAGEAGPQGLIGQYEQARQAGEEAEAEKLLEQIDAVLSDSGTTGEANQIIASAEARKTATSERVRRSVETFEQILPGFAKTPEFLLQRKWTETLEEILSSPTVEKVVVEVRDNKIVLRTGQDPRIAKQILAERLKKARQEEEARKKKSE